MSEEIVPGIYRIELPLPRNPLKALNAYLVRGEGRHLLVDTGFNRAECREALFASLEALGLELRELDLFITHLHSDHCGLAAELAAAGSGLVYASPGDGAAINLAGAGEEFWLELLRAMARHGCSGELLEDMATGHPGKRFAPCGRIDFTAAREGDVLRYGAYALRVLSVPGHTPEHLALYEPSRRLFFAGDLILGDITPNITHWRELPDALGSYLQSLDKAEALDIALTLPGHRSLVRDTRGRLAELRAHHARRLDEVLSVLRGRELDACKVAQEMSWDIRAASWEHFPAAQKWFAVGEALAHLEHLCATGRARRKDEAEITLFSAT